MSAYHGYQGQQQPQPPRFGGMPPPPGAGGMGGMPPPPGQPGGQGFGRPPPPNQFQQNQGQQQMPPPPGQGRGMPPPPNMSSGPFGGPSRPGPPGPPGPSGPPPQPAPPQQRQPPPPGQFQQPPAPSQMQQQGPPAPGMNQLQQGMGNMSLGGIAGPPGGMPGPPKPFGAGPPPPGAPRMFQPPPPGGQQPPPPQQQSNAGHLPPGQPPGPPQPPAGTAFYPQQQPHPSQPPSQMSSAPRPDGGAPGMMPGVPGMSSAPGMAPGAPGMSSNPEYFQENIDYSIQVPSRILRLTSQYIPASATLANSTKVPLGAVIRPLAPMSESDEEEEDVKVVQPGAAGIVRCKRCRTYINAFVTWLETGRRWRCNICAQLNECPAPYFCHLDEEGRRRDRDQRPELSEGIVEFIAPSEYMVRPPQPPSYFFVIDVSATSVKSGMLKSVAAAISKSLDDLPGAPRTQVGFLTYDESVHYYSLKSGLANPQMLVVADLVELFVPAPDDLLVNLQESREVVDIFLQNLPSMFENNTSEAACLGPALKAAFTVTKHIGGKMCVFQSVLPTLGDGALTPRENNQIMGTPDEVKLLRPSVNWYKDTAIEFSRAQISVDMFLFPRAYIDVASLSELPKITAGTLHTYPGFNHNIDGHRFESELSRVLTQTTAFEAVMRIRCTRGMRINNFYGNFFVRGSDLLALPNCTSDSVFAFDLVHDEPNVTSSVVTVQSALLYTSSEGERRIRVVTQAIPVSSIGSEVIQSVDSDAVAALLAKQALDISIKSNLDNARVKLQQVCADLIRASKEGDKPRTVSGYAAPPMQQHYPSDDEIKSTPENLKLLPLYTLGLIKNVAFRGGTDVHPDERVHAMHRLLNMSVTDSKHFIYPRMFSLHDMGSSAGLPSNSEPSSEDDENVAGPDRIELPRVLNLTVDRLTSDGIFLLDNGLDMYLWVGRSSDSALLNSLFGTNSLEGSDMSQVKLFTSGNDFASRLNAIVTSLRENDTEQSLVAKVTIVREGDHGLESRFFWHLIEDRASFNGGTYSYSDFVQFVESSGSKGGMPPAAGPPGGPRGIPPPGPPGPPGPPSHHGGGPTQRAQYSGIQPPSMNQGPPPPNQMRGPPPPGPPPGQQQYGAPTPGPPSSGPPSSGTRMHMGTPSGGPPPPGPPSYGQQHGQYGAPPGPPQGQMGYRGPPGPPPPGQYGGPPRPGPPSGGMPPPPQFHR